VRETRNDDSLTTTRGSGFLGASRRVTGDVWAFADYRNTFKPAAIDFGVEEEEEGEEILEPETSQSYEAGIKGQTPRAFWQVSAFVMNMENLVVAQEEDGLPVLRNAGKLRFKGVELETSYRVTDALRATASYARHDARFGDYVQDFDGVATQLRGKRFEMSARDLASAGLLFGAASGWRANVTASYTGSRFLNKRNTAPAGSFTAINAGVGYASAWGELRLDARNLTNRRDPVAESELGDAQYYLLPARTLRVTYTRNW
jgi:iron complex outermembrane receptor protein